MYATIDKNGHFTGVVYSEMTQVVQDWHDDMGFTWIAVEKSPEPVGPDGEYGKPTAKEKLAAVKQAKIYEINIAFQEADLNPVVVGEHAYIGGFESGLALDAQRRMLIEYAKANPLAGITTVDLFDIAGATITLPLNSDTELDALDICLAVGQTATINSFKCAQLIAAVRAANSIEAVSAIHW